MVAARELCYSAKSCHHEGVISSRYCTLVVCDAVPLPRLRPCSSRIVLSVAAGSLVSCRLA